MNFLKTLTLVFNGLIVNQLKKLEIKVHVDLVGHLELLKHLVTESALQVDKNNKQESQQKIWLVVVESVAVWDVTVDGHMLLGLILRMQVFQQDGFTILQTGASRTVSPHVITIRLEDLSHVELLNQPQNVKNHALQDIQHNTKKIFIMQRKFIQSQKM